MIKLILTIGLLLLPLQSFGADVYITQNTSGGDTGVDCANAHSAAWFDINAVGGNIYHLCGTFTGAANSTMLTIPASGTAGNILYVLFETGAKLTSPQWNDNGAIYSNGKNYVTIDGGSNGVIENTDNGSATLGYTYHTNSRGILMSGHHIIIKNLNINNIYMNDGATCKDVGERDISGASTYGIYVLSSGEGSITVTANSVNNARYGVAVGVGDAGQGDNIDISYNTTRKHCFQIAATSTNANLSISNFNIHHNNFGDWGPWNYPGGACTPDTYHQDGIYISGRSTVTDDRINIYSNVGYGVTGGSVTASIYSTYYYSAEAEPPGIALNIYNNILVPDPVAGGVSIIALNSGKSNSIYNNTIVGSSDGTGGKALEMGLANTQADFANNIVANVKYGISTSDSLFTLGVVDYNIWYNVTDTDHIWSYGGHYHNLTQWRAHGFDVNGSYSVLGGASNPKFISSTDYRLQSDSPAINTGCSTDCDASEAVLDLTALFTTDYLGTSRPQGSAWDIGAYELVEWSKTIPGTGPKVTPGSGAKRSQ